MPRRLQTDSKKLNLLSGHRGHGAPLPAAPSRSAAEPELTRLISSFESAQATADVSKLAKLPPELLDFATCLDPSSADQSALQRKALATYQDWMHTTPVGSIERSFRTYDLWRAREQLPAECQPIIEALAGEIAPIAPPYDAWFKDGSTSLNVHYYVADRAEDDVQVLKDTLGFEATRQLDGTTLLRKDFRTPIPGADGPRLVRTQVTLTVHPSAHGLFRHAKDPDVHFIAYGGHADYGRRVPLQLVGQPDAFSGPKCFAGLQCGGRSTQQALQEKYPGLQVVTTLRSAWPADNQTAFVSLIQGFVHRETWREISSRNPRRCADNYYFPSDLTAQKQAVDLDHDGVADALDRVPSQPTAPAETPHAQQLIPRAPSAPLSELDGARFHQAVMRLHRLAGKNEWTAALYKKMFVADGYFEGGPHAPLMKLHEAKLGGQTLLKLQLNAHYAHASEETLGAALHYELAKQEARREGLTETEATCAGLLMAARCLQVDFTSRAAEDEASWLALLRYARLPENISFFATASAATSDAVWGAGSQAALDALQDHLDQEAIRLP